MDSAQAVEPVRLKKAPPYRWVIMIMSSVAFAYYFMMMQLVGGFSTYIMADLGISSALLGFLVTATLITHTISSGYAGALVDRFGARYTVTVGIVGVALTTLLYPIAASFEMLLAVRLFQGMFAGFIVGPCLGAIPIWFEKKQRAIASGIAAGFMSLGSAITNAAAPMIMVTGAFSWQWACVALITVPGLILAVLYFVLMRDIRKEYGVDSIGEALGETEDEAKVAADVPKTWDETKRSVPFIAGIVLLFCHCFILYGLNSFLTLFLTDDLGLAADQVSSWSFIILIAGFITTPLGGIISDTVFHSRRSPMLMISFLLVIVACLLIPYASIVLMPVALFLAAGAMPSINGPFWALTGEISDPKFATRINSRWMLIGQVGGIIAAPVLGFIAGLAGNYLSIMYVFVLFGVIGLVAAKLIKH